MMDSFVNFSQGEILRQYIVNDQFLADSNFQKILDSTQLNLSME